MAMRLLEAQRMARFLGATAEIRTRTGHITFTHPLHHLPCHVHCHRHDAPRHLVVWLKRVQDNIAFLRAFLEIVPGPEVGPVPSLPSFAASGHR